MNSPADFISEKIKELEGLSGDGYTLVEDIPALLSAMKVMVGALVGGTTTGGVFWREEAIAEAAKILGEGGST